MHGAIYTKRHTGVSRLSRDGSSAADCRPLRPITAVTIMRKVDINFVEISEANVLPLAHRRIVFAIRAQPKAESTYANYKEEQHERSTEFLRWSGKP